MNHEFIYSQTAQYIISNNILAPLQHVQPLRNWTGERAAPPPHSGGGGGGGGWNEIRFQILDPLEISDITHPKKQISDISHSQKSDIWLKKIRYIRYQTPKKN